MKITFIDYNCKCGLNCWCLPRDLLSDIYKKLCNQEEKKMRHNFEVHKTKLCGFFKITVLGKGNWGG